MTMNTHNAVQQTFSGPVDPRFRSGAFPSFLAAQFREARRGGAYGFAYVGASVAKSLMTNYLEPWDVEIAEWGDFIQTTLVERIFEHDDEYVWDWLAAYLPRIAAQVPPHRRATFLRGLNREIEEGGWYLR